MSTVVLQVPTAAEIADQCNKQSAGHFVQIMIFNADGAPGFAMNGPASHFFAQRVYQLAHETPAMMGAETSTRSVFGQHSNVDHRHITSHRLEGTTSPGDPLYRIQVHEPGHTDKPVQFVGEIKFQDGPIKEAGLNGWTNEDLLIIVADRLKSFQASKFNCQENADALQDVEDALAHLNSRTARRRAEGAEGTHKPDAAKPPRHPATQSILQFFAFGHLPPQLRQISEPFCALAERVADGPSNAEATVALRKLLEAKDAAVRAALFKP